MQVGFYMSVFFRCNILECLLTTYEAVHVITNNSFTINTIIKSHAFRISLVAVM